jgi:Leucine-rich repeat (LRR) protein
MFNGIKSVNPSTFNGLNNLEILDLTKNKVDLIVKGMFQNIPNLKILYLSQNPIQDISDSAFSDLQNLPHLDLSDVYFLLMYHNYPKPNFFSGLRKLNILDLSAVYLSRLEDSDLSVLFKDQTDSLTELYLQGTQLTNKLLPMIKNLKYLEELYIIENDIGYIKRYSLPKLVQKGNLYLKNNKITYVDQDAFEDMRNNSVGLGSNPFDCSCKHDSFSRWLRSDKGAVVIDRNDLFCGSPIDLY